MKLVKRESNIGELPHDCWTHIILFFDAKIDFFSLILCIKGLFNHVQSIFPRCTQNIELTNPKFPNKVKRWVSNLKVRKRRKHASFEEIMQYCGVENFNELVAKIETSYPNLVILKISLLRAKYDDAWILDHVKFSTSNMTGLSSLTLELSDCDLTLQSYHPNLTRLSLCEKSEQSEPRQNLDIDWTKIPRLKVLRLFGWNLLSKLEDIKNEIEELVLSGTTILDDTIIGYNRLQILKIHHHTIPLIKHLSDVPSLITLMIETTGTWYDQYQNSSLYVEKVVFPFHLQIQGFPKLEIFSINESQGCDRYEQQMDLQLPPTHKKFLLKNLPSLHTVAVVDVLFNIEIENTPALFHVESEMSSLVDFVNPQDCSRMDFFWLNQSRMPPAFAKHISSSSSSYKMNLRVFICSQTEAGPMEAMDPISIRSMGFLEIVNFDAGCCFEVECVVECPNLKELEFNPSQNCILHDLPSLKEVKAYVSSNRMEVSVDEIKLRTINILKQLQFIPSIVTLSMAGCRLSGCSFQSQWIRQIQYLEISNFDVFRWDGENFSNLRGVSQDSFFPFIKPGVFYSLTKHPRIEVVNMNIDPLSREIRITSCPNLEMVKLSTVKYDERMDKDDCFDTMITLKNLPRCSKLVLKMERRKYFTPKFNIDISSCIKILELGRRNGYSSDRGTKKHEIILSESNFPHLEIIRMEKNVYRVLTIVEIRNLKVLKEIELNGKKLGKGFKPKVVGIDQKEVVVNVIHESRKTTFTENLYDFLQEK